MSEISLRLTWLVVQVTLVSAGATILLAILHRWRSIATAGLLQAALLLVLMLTVVSPSPWPTWTTFRASELQVVVAQPIK